MAGEQDLIERQEAVWRSIESLCAELTEEQWKTPTDCPGWSVQDNLSHLGGNEGVMFLGRARPDHAVPDDLPYIRNDIGKTNEVVVDFRRSWPGARVLDEFREVTATRLEALRAMTESDLDKDSWTPAGPGKVRDMVAIRIFDAWVHEQDMRRALGKAGNLDGPVAEHALGRIVMALPFVVGKKVAPPDGSSVVFEVTGPAGRTIPIVAEGRARVADSIPDSPTVKLTMDLETLACLGCGRKSADEMSGRVAIHGDEALGRKVLEQLNFMV